MKPLRLFRSIALAAALLVPLACERGLSVDWSAPENFFVVEKTDDTEEGARLEFHSLVDAPPKTVFELLAQPERYSQFIEGVQDSGMVTSQGNKKTTVITQNVVGRQSRATVEWTVYPEEMRLQFRTVQSDGNYNDGEQKVIPSPDGKRAYVISVYHVKEMGTKAPIGVLKTATRQSFERAAASVKKRANEMGGSA